MTTILYSLINIIYLFTQFLKQNAQFRIVFKIWWLIIAFKFNNITPPDRVIHPWYVPWISLFFIIFCPTKMLLHEKINHIIVHLLCKFQNNKFNRFFFFLYTRLNRTICGLIYIMYIFNYSSAKNVILWKD